MENYLKENHNQELYPDKIKQGLYTADCFINRTYLFHLHEQEIIPLAAEEKKTSFMRIYEIQKFVYQKDENINDKLISVYSALQNIGSSAVLIIEGKAKETSFYIGIRSAGNASTASKILQKGFEGNFPGSTLKHLNNSEIKSLLKEIVDGKLGRSSKNVASATIIPSMRDEDKDKFVQGIEKFVDTMQGEEYSAIIIASPVSKKELCQRKGGYEEIYSALSPLQKTTFAYGKNTSRAVANGISENFSISINKGISDSTGTNKSMSYSSNQGSNSGFGIAGFNLGSSSGTSGSFSHGSFKSSTVTSGRTETKSAGTNTSETLTDGDSETWTIEQTNKSVATLLEKIDKQMERFHSCEAFGVWECAAYFIADDAQTAVVGANAYKSILLGDDTSVEDSYVNVWNSFGSIPASNILDYLEYGKHPVLKISAGTGYSEQHVTPTSYISGKELPLLMGIPHHSVSGLTVCSNAAFGRNIFIQQDKEMEKTIDIGSIYHMGKKENIPVRLNLNSFTSHCFITGSTGSGKSNTTYCLLERFIENNIPFLVIEPAKGEYKDAFSKVNGIHIFSTNPYIGQMLKLNPFRFDERIHVLEHLDRLIEIFNACWEMYAAMPAILKDAAERIYVEKGWDLLNSIYLGEGDPVYPTFADLLRVLPEIINTSDYSADTKGDYTGALVTRVASLTNGISGQIFCDCYDIPDETLFDENAIVDLSRVGSSETKSLIMGMLVLKLTEYRMARSDGSNKELQHITVLEEAHNLLKNSHQSQNNSSVVAKSVEMICNSIAEMRTYGEGFIIVDQSPTAVDIAAIKNTNTKILMRLPEKNDCDAVGNAVGLTEEQIKELSKLNTGVAAVMQNNWIEAVLAQIDKASDSYSESVCRTSYEEIKQLRGSVIKELMDQYIVHRKMELDKILMVIDENHISEYKKAEMRCCMKHVVAHLEKGRDIEYFCTNLLNISGSKELFRIKEKAIKNLKNIDETAKEEEIRKWKEEFVSGINSYVFLPPAYGNTLFQYLLYAKENETTDINYSSIYKTLY